MGAAAVSVIVATWNRAPQLRQTLHDLIRQATGGAFTFDILVADNNSSDTTRAVVSEFAAASAVPVRYVFEPRQGKGYALNRALTQADGELIAFTDDDVSVEPTWLAALLRPFREQAADGAGGPVKPLWISQRPTWLDDQLVRQLGMVDHGPAPRRMRTEREWFIGPNCAYRRALFDRLGGFATDDPAEDYDWFLRVLRAGGRLFYQPEAVVWHKVDAAGLTPRRVGDRLFRHGRGYGMRLQERAEGRRVCRVPTWMARQYLDLYVETARARTRGDATAARWSWFQRHTFHGAIAQCVVDWARGAPVPRPRPTLQPEPSTGARAARVSPGSV